MNYNLATREGMNNAVEWFKKFVEYLNQGGTWVIPRAGSCYRIDHEAHEIELTFGDGDKPTERVAKAAGWRVKRDD